MTTHPLIATVEGRFGGVLTHGKHAPDGQACFMEVIATRHPRIDDPASVTLSIGALILVSGSVPEWTT